MFGDHYSHTDPCNLRPPDQDPRYEFRGLSKLAEESRKTDTIPDPDSDVAVLDQIPEGTRTRLPRTEIHNATRWSGRRLQGCSAPASLAQIRVWRVHLETRDV